MAPVTSSILISEGLGRSISMGSEMRRRLESILSESARFRDARREAGNQGPFVDAYRTILLAPASEVLAVLRSLQEFDLVA